MKVLTLPASARTRALEFLKEFEVAPNDADIDIHTGQMETGEPAVLVILAGKGHGFTTKEARMIADIAEEGMRAFPNDPRANEFPNLIMALRFGADKADAGLTRDQREEGNG